MTVRPLVSVIFVVCTSPLPLVGSVVDTVIPPDLSAAMTCSRVMPRADAIWSMLLPPVTSLTILRAVAASAALSSGVPPSSLTGVAVGAKKSGCW
ncbi:hypothetical protein [Mesorhizobium sp.]|uniref:hypothetical protein n=1 Tax=Mesorhizobium sp. TaxID=1871066 RepID=UPI0025CBBBF9|nr:hypothetical protein [Mesorhizobium sp.]